jgi:hypothetical protein
VGRRGSRGLGASRGRCRPRRLRRRAAPSLTLARLRGSEGWGSSAGPVPGIAPYAMPMRAATRTKNNEITLLSIQWKGRDSSVGPLSISISCGRNSLLSGTMKFCRRSTNSRSPINRKTMKFIQRAKPGNRHHSYGSSVRQERAGTRRAGPLEEIGFPPAPVDHVGGPTRAAATSLWLAASNTRESSGEKPILTGSPTAWAATEPCSRTRKYPASVSTT